MNAHGQVGRTLAELGETASARRDLAAAQSCYAEAVALCEGLRAAPETERVRAAMAGLI